MKKLVFCLIGTCILFMFIPFQLKADTTFYTDSLVVSRPFEHREKRSERDITKKNIMMDTSKSRLFEKARLQLNDPDSKKHRDEMKGTLYVSYGIEFLITLLVIILL